jgi:hypothetical protein
MRWAVVWLTHLGKWPHHAKLGPRVASNLYKFKTKVASHVKCQLLIKFTGSSVLPAFDTRQRLSTPLAIVVQHAPLLLFILSLSPVRDPSMKDTTYYNVVWIEYDALRKVKCTIIKFHLAMFIQSKCALFIITGKGWSFKASNLIHSDLLGILHAIWRLKYKTLNNYHATVNIKYMNSLIFLNNSPLNISPHFRFSLVSIAFLLLLIHVNLISSGPTTIQRILFSLNSCFSK